MGNIRPTYIKRIAKELINMYPDKFVASDFQHNKEKVAELADFDSKVMQNRVAGYISPLMAGCMDKNIHIFQENLWQEKTLKYLEGSSKSKLYQILRHTYDRFLYPIRNIYLADYLSKFVSHGESILDIGCAEGTIPYLISQKKNVTVHGADIYFKSEPLIPYTYYEGATLPFKDKQFDCSIAIDVLHHCENIKGILQEMIRVSHRIIIKDHYYKSGWGHFLLKLFDISANKPYGVNIIFNFKKWEEWEQIFKELNLNYSYVDKKMDRIKLGPLRHFCILLKENSEG